MVGSYQCLLLFRTRSLAEFVYTCVYMFVCMCVCVCVCVHVCMCVWCFVCVCVCIAGGRSLQDDLRSRDTPQIYFRHK